MRGLHVAIIMDGNGRWALERGRTRMEGHRAGVAAARRVVESALDRGIARLTLYAFSSDNWRRPAREVAGIFWLLRAFLRLETRRLQERGVRLRAIGRRDRLGPPVLEAIEKAEGATARGTRLELAVAIDYSARDAITLAAAGLTASPTRAADVDVQTLRQRLEDVLLAEGGEVDLLVRTGGEKRLSDFLLWEAAYAELVFLDCMWPEFTAEDFDRALGEFRRRERRFGGVPAGAVETGALPV